MGAARWQWWYAGALALLLGVQSLVRLVFSRTAILVARYDLAVHVVLIVAVLAGVAFLVALFPNDRRGRRWAALTAVALLAPLHAIASLFDAVAMTMYYLTGLAAPFTLARRAPALALALLDSIGIDATRVALVVAAALVGHIVLYLPVAGLLATLARRTMAWRLKLPAGRHVALRWLVPPLVAAALLLQHSRPLIWAHANSFVIAPDGLMSGHGESSTADMPESDLPNARPLVVVIVDALRRDRMGVYNPALANTPFLDELKARGTLRVYDPSFATCTYSYCGIMSVLSSHSWDDFGRRPATIIDALGRHRYRSYLMMAGSNTRYSNIVEKFGGPIALLHDERPPLGTLSDDRRVLAMLRASTFPDPRHSFIYIHLMSAHDGSTLRPEFVAAARNSDPRYPYALRYDARVRQADAVLRDIVAALRERGLGDALLVITGDHGERIGEGGKLYHGGRPDPAAIAAPLMIYDPRGSTRSWPARPVVSQIDIAPTLLVAAGGTPLPEWRGTALQRSAPRPVVPIGTFETAGLVGIVGGRQVQYRCERQNGRESITVLDGHGDGAAMSLAHVPHLLSLLRRWQREIAPVATGRCRH